MKPDINETNHVSNKTRFFNNLAYFALGIIAIFVATTLYWLLSGNDAIEVKTPIPVQPVVIVDEKSITLKMTYCKYTKDEGRVVRRFVNESAEIFAPTISGQFQPGCHKDVPIEIPLPDTIRPGVYHVNYRITYQTNPLKSVIEDFNSEEFTVKPRQ